MYLGGWESLLVLGVGRSDGSPASTCLCICILEMEMTNSRPLHFPVGTHCSCGSLLWELAVHKGSGLVGRTHHIHAAPGVPSVPAWACSGDGWGVLCELKPWTGWWMFLCITDDALIAESSNCSFLSAFFPSCNAASSLSVLSRG